MLGISVTYTPQRMHALSTLSTALCTVQYNDNVYMQSPLTIVYIWLLIDTS